MNIAALNAGLAPLTTSPWSPGMPGSMGWVSTQGDTPLTTDMSGLRPDLSGLDLSKTGFFGGASGMGKLGFGINALSSLGGMFAAFKQLGLTNKALNFQRSVVNANLGNQIQSYNTALADRARSRAAVEGTGQASADAYVNANKLNKVTL